MKIVVNFSPFFCETNLCWQFAKNTPAPLYDGDTELLSQFIKWSSGTRVKCCSTARRGPGCDNWWQWAVATPGEDPLVPVVIISLDCDTGPCGHCNTQWGLCHEDQGGSHWWSAHHSHTILGKLFTRIMIMGPHQDPGQAFTINCILLGELIIQSAAVAVIVQSSGLVWISWRLRNCNRWEPEK